jgi:hypothetical protein
VPESGNKAIKAGIEGWNPDKRGGIEAVSGNFDELRMGI